MSKRNVIKKIKELLEKNPQKILVEHEVVIGGRVKILFGECIDAKLEEEDKTLTLKTDSPRVCSSCGRKL